MTGTKEKTFRKNEKGPTFSNSIDVPKQEKNLILLFVTIIGFKRFLKLVECDLSLLAKDCLKYSLDIFVFPSTLTKLIG